MHRSCSELSFKVKQLEVHFINHFFPLFFARSSIAQEALRQERALVASLRSEHVSFLANLDNMNSMFDVARKLTRLAVAWKLCT
jgi:hypothetical protein